MGGAERVRRIPVNDAEAQLAELQKSIAQKGRAWGTKLGKANRAVAKLTDERDDLRAKLVRAEQVISGLSGDMDRAREALMNLRRKQPDPSAATSADAFLMEQIVQERDALAQRVRELDAPEVRLRSAVEEWMYEVTRRDLDHGRELMTELRVYAHHTTCPAEYGEQYGCRCGLRELEEEIDLWERLSGREERV
jgi:chromosome segregation ATPase